MVAAGNSNLPMTSDSSAWPGRYGGDSTLPCVLTVAASTNSGGRASFSNYGSPIVEIAAPGDQIYSTVRASDSAYATFSGTSMATPFVAGAPHAVLAVARLAAAGCAAHDPGAHNRLLLTRRLLRSPCCLGAPSTPAHTSRRAGPLECVSVAHGGAG